MYISLHEAGEFFHYLTTLIPAIPPFVIMAAITVLFVSIIVAVASKVGNLFTIIAHRKKDDSHRDAKRVFTAKEKAQMSRQCGNRCEGTGLFFRCRYTGVDLHGDHWYPHSKGGATTMDNLVMLCPQCNRRKSDTIPTSLQTKALSWRRKHHHDYSSKLPTPGKWLPRGYSNDNGKQTPLRIQRPSF